MKRIVVYTSKTGFTKKYAEWIAEDLQCEVRELSKVSADLLKEYEQVIYGGWIMGGMICGYDKIKPLHLENLVVFGCGMTVPSEEVRKQVAKQNEIPVERFFYLEGGYNPKKVGFVGKMMINMISGSIKKKEQKTPEELHMLETVSGADRTTKESIMPILSYINGEGR
ncbi:MAG: flavodoxin domain-containing protein [Thermoflexaceae bacterium]|nr:flavodoxin domain-containing protein [Thermoflexaceae bacterium]